VADEDVGLVDLVPKDDEFIFGGEFKHGADVVGGETRAGGVAGIDDHDGAHVCAFGLGFLVRRFDG